MARKEFLLAIFFATVCLMQQTRGLAYSKDDDKISLSSSDKGKIEKAEGLRKKSDKTMQDVDKAYADIAAKQADLTSEESDKLNNKALEKQIEALKIRKQGNDLEYNTYVSKVEEFWKKFKGNSEQMGYAKSLESEAKLKYQTANEQFKDADKSDDKLIGYSKMTTASELLSNAVSSMKLTFETYANTSLTTGLSESTQVAVKQDTIPVATVDTTKSISLNSQAVPPVVTPNIIIPVATSNTDTLSTTVPVSSTFVDTTSLKPVNNQVSNTSITAPVTAPAINVAPVVETSSNVAAVEPVIVKTDSVKTEPVTTSALPQQQAPEQKANLYQAVKVNEEMIDRFNKFMKNQYPKEYENYIIDFNGLNYSDVESIKTAWYNYLYGSLKENQETLASENKIDSTTIIVTDSVKMAYNNENKSVNDFY